MRSEESKNPEQEEFAEKCRRALENDLGFAIPLPGKSSTETEQQEKKLNENTEPAPNMKSAKEPLNQYHRSVDVTSFSRKLSLLSQELDEETLQTVDKIKNQERLSTDEFQRLFNAIWKKGPDSKVNIPNKWFDDE